LLVEPAATNLVLRSEEFSVSGTWVPVDTTITANDFTAPNGTMTADRMVISGTNSRVTQSFVLAATTVTFSVYLYSAVSFTLRLVATVDGANVNRIVTIPAGQWTRFAQTFTSIATITNVQIRGQAGGSTGDIFLWGAQLETGSVATSYIPTVAATATRNADVISKTGVSGFIGQSQGTLYAEFAYLGAPTIRSGPIYLRQANLRGIALNYESAVAGIQAVSRNNAGTSFITAVSGTLQIGTIYKVAIAYDAAGTAAGGTQVNGITVYVNGVLAGTGNFQVPDAAGLNDIRLYGANSSTDAEAFNGRIRAAAIYPTRLTNAQLASLTTL
jgi:hypothetical protein